MSDSNSYLDRSEERCQFGDKLLQPRLVDELLSVLILCKFIRAVAVGVVYISLQHRLSSKRKCVEAGLELASSIVKDRQNLQS